MKTLILAILLIFLPAFSPMPGRAAAPPSQSSDNAKNQSQHNQNNSTSALAVNKQKQPISTDNHPGQVAPQNEEQSVNLTRLPPITIVKGKKSFWDHVFDWGPWVFSFLLFVVGALQVWLLSGTMQAIKRQAYFQQVALQQWVDVTAWDTESSEIGKNLIIRFEISNPSQFPLAIKESAIIFGVSDKRLAYSLGDDFRLSPKIPKPVELKMWITKDEYERFLNNGLVIDVQGNILHTDTGPNKLTTFLLNGRLICGRNGTRFYPEPITPTEADGKRQKA